MSGRNWGKGPEKMAHVAVNGLWASDPDYTISSLAKYLRDLEKYDGNILGDLAFREEPRHPLFKALMDKQVFEETYLKRIKVTLEEFYGSLSLQGEQVFNQLPENLYIQLDNSAKDNKNWSIMAFLSELVSRGVFKTVTMSFLIVGHTHEDVDAFFSMVHKAMLHRHIQTFPEFLAEIHEVETKKTYCRLIQEVVDYKSHIEAYVDVPIGHSVPISLRSSMSNNIPIYQYQEDYGGPWFPTHGVSMWKPIDTLSQTYRCVRPPPLREPKTKLCVCVCIHMAMQPED
ncbi:hypothetical protein R1sor_000944 [Riccia sorocarpa]|uniref:DUF7869 domain-containing protein n=1 Tax=Riccia sorocarpa TaxID=122646 RepID=A0ABD3GUJ3_9MARC